MTNSPASKEKEPGLTERLLTPIHRRGFLQAAGVVAAGTAIALSGCKDEDDVEPFVGVTFSDDDDGIMNYAYALEQLEAAFYIQLIDSIADNPNAATFFSSDATVSQAILDRFTDIRDHEIAHRDLFKASLGSKSIANLEFDFSIIDFNSASEVLETAQTFEDLGVAAYNGAGPLLDSADLLKIAGKIVSVEARHAAFIRELVRPGSFSGTTTTGLDPYMLPSQVLAAADPFIKTAINNKLP
jgi:hypothetical protein